MRLLAPVLLVAAVPVFGLVAIHHDRHVNEDRLGKVASHIAGAESRSTAPAP
jgi:hypothetical protein